MTSDRPGTMGCEHVDDFAGAAALGALEADEARAISHHLATCGRPHDDLRPLLGSDAILGAALEPMPPDPSLRSRLMASVAATPQDHVIAPTTDQNSASSVRGRWLDWSSVGLWRGLAGAAAVVIIALGAWNIGLRQQMAVQDAALSAIGEVVLGGQPAYAVRGPAGNGYVIDTEGPGATFLVAGLDELPTGDIYELWLLDAAGTPLAVGTIEVADPVLAVVALEQDLAGFATFAVTVEAERVGEPTGDPVMVGAISN
ncbi:MAG: anti-sigma factor domain-containing protein [Candidatus Limnocylindria bacterium]